jgi:DNA-binding response OmpR family regulator
MLCLHLPFSRFPFPSPVVAGLRERGAGACNRELTSTYDIATMKKKTVLIVEDSPGFSELMKFVVEDEGFRGVVFPLEQDFLQWVDKEKPSAIIMDLALNRLSGFDLIRDLKVHARHKTIPVIVITGRDLDVKDITELKMYGIPYLRKGRVDMHEIHQNIRDAVAKSDVG